MRAEVFPGRYTVAETDQEVTVFLIGVRVNKWWKLPVWLPVAKAMPPMLKHLQAEPEAGLLGFESWFGRTTILLTYWTSPAHLRDFASDARAPHLAPWRRYMKEVGSSGDVGVWHETFKVAAADREAVYANMPRFGLANALGHAKIGPGRNTARQRMRSQ